ncbi:MULTISPECIES: DNA mismatch repair endonuclease MutL [unclassified Prosthecochloris]|uniref:DNA mismatch repair endonuclease MutL n=1 Tax=unclassified Prosthecochloris TaxID=2632826 RepID=UPI00223DE73B|nr:MULTISPECIES: DNA mismatch repair endonuclease MutL [unclassified Prosthecochloris]UZJ37427.1 DNA mismatch repair endonuclease MutL [Prosthecochloris sp. SCSIO W1103]UZJ39250.1 DNA mismatch repair endonuclease MutL [Prosthecochloris sp. SCSIO W1102]
MPRINRLPDIVANKISAGEVVQRPASVVKELLENAVDAGATRITVSVKEAGKQLVQVIDNGEGMDEEDAARCVERFATSKISSAEELDALGTLGFRGEALASISAVSHFEIRTRRESDSVGIQLRYEGGEPVEKGMAACDPGTMVSVRNLFYNVPARRKFLKTNATEFKHIFESVKAQVLAYPEIQWQMFNDEQELFDFKSTDIFERINFFFGEDFAESLIEVHEDNDFLSLHGYVGKPAMQKRQKSEQFIYVNRRVIQNRMLSQALQQAYGELLIERHTPFALLFLRLDTQQIDVNVHPSKLEVKFEDERSVRTMFYTIIKKAVRSQDFSPDVGGVCFQEGNQDFSRRRSEVNEARLEYHKIPSATSTTGALYSEYRDGDRYEEAPGKTIVSEQKEMFAQEEMFAAERDHFVEPQRELRRSDFVQASGGIADEDLQGEQVSDPKIWQLHNKYIVCQIKTGLMVIDQHVAHERVLYERAVDIMDNNVPNSQQLLFPQKVDLKSWEFEIFEEICGDLERLGFNLSTLGARTVMIEGVPQDVRSGSEAYILQDMIQEYQHNAEKLKLEKRENLAKSYSCRNAIMTGQKLSIDDMRSLIDRLFATKMPYVCPHGRPVIIRISLEQLDRMFGRK